ncbi:hypothetical protein QQ045_016187 [Rhodiola kirilowii]
MRLPDELGSLVLDPYTQVVLAVCHKFYASLPSLGMNMDAFRILHYYRRISTINGPGMPVDELVRNWYSELSAAGLDDLTTKVSLIFINHSQAQFSDLETGVSRLTLENRLTLVRQYLPQAYTIFNMLSHFCLGGIECVEPIPEMIRGNIGLSRYITAIARGNGDIHTLALSITPRPSDRPVARYRPEAHAHLSPIQSTQPPNSSTSLPPLTFSASGSTPITNSALTPSVEPVPVSTGLAPPPIQFGTVVPEETGENSEDVSYDDLGPRRIHTVTNAPGSLLAQGDPSRIQIIRDTTNFRDRIQERIDTSGELTSIHSKVDMILDEVPRMATELTLCRNENEQMKQELQIMSRNYTEMNRSFTLMIAQSSQHNLAERQLINSQLLQSQTQEGSQIIAAAPRIAPAPADNLRDVIHRLETYPSSNESVNGLVNDVKSLLEEMGKRDLARGVTVASINNPMARARALAILKNVPRA